MSSFWKIDFDKPLSVVIGRIIIRVLVIVLIVLAFVKAFQTYRQYQMDQEIAPVHKFAQSILESFKKGDYFKIQERLDPKLQHITSIDWLAHFVKNSELNASNGGNWGKWSKKEDHNSTIYTLEGVLHYTTGRQSAMKWEIRSAEHNMTVMGLKLGKRRLKPPISSLFR